MAARELPPDVAAAFDSAPGARERFAALPPERQAEWLAWIDRARGRARAGRIDEAMRRLGAAPVAAGATEETVEEAPPPPPPERHWWVWLLLLLLLVIAGLLAWFFLTRGDDKKTVPAVTGLPQQQAERRIHDRGLKVLTENRASQKPVGIVVAQRPGGGTQVGKNDPVTLAISSGPARGTVPDVSGQPLASARTQLQAAGFKSTVKRAFSARPKGVVVSQSPAAGVTAQKGVPITLTVSKGKQLVTAPALVGLRENLALRQITKAGLVANVKRVTSAKPAGTVIAQKPPAAKRVPKGSTVQLTIAAKPGTTTTVATTTTRATTTTNTTNTTTTAVGAAQTSTVPQLVGQRLTFAIQRLRVLGLRPTVVFVASSRPANRVVAQRPVAGVQIAKGSRVRLNASIGPNPQQLRAVPDVLGQEQTSATQTLTQAGFQVAVIPQPTNDPSQQGIVLDEQPAAGARIPRGSQVTIFVGTAP